MKELEVQSVLPSVERFGFHRLLMAWLVVTTCALGIAFLMGSAWTLGPFLGLAYFALLVGAISASARWDDWLNPLILLMAFAFLRFSLPGLVGIRQGYPDLLLFDSMGLDEDAWTAGHVISVLGMLGLLLGWQFPSLLDRSWTRRVLRTIPRSLSPGLLLIGTLSMLAGLGALYFFVSGNASLAWVLSSGSFREVEIQEGTGKYRFLSYLLLSGSVVLTAYLFRSDYRWWVALGPVALATLGFAVLGGRSRAIGPFMAGLVLLWYERGDRRLSLKVALGGFATAAFLVLFFFLVAQYRGAADLADLGQVLTWDTLRGYLQYAMWVDIGHLHAMAGASLIGPGVLDGRTFHSLTWPLQGVLGLEGKSAGVFIVQELLGGEGWGFHTSMIGDAYLNYGLIAVVLVPALFGMIVRTLYGAFRHGMLEGVVYALFLPYGLRMFFGSIERYRDLLVVMVSLIVIMKVGEGFGRYFMSAEGKAWGRRIPGPAPGAAGPEVVS